MTHTYLRLFAIGFTLALVMFAFGLVGRLDRQAEAASLSSYTCISAMVMENGTTTTSPITCIGNPDGR